MNKVIILLVLVSLGCSSIIAQAPFQLTKTDQLEAISLFREVLSIPNDAHFPDDIEVNMKWCEEAFTKRNFNTTRLKTDGIPLLLANYNTTMAGQPTVLIYLQIDGQPVDPDFWWQEDPFTPALKEQSADGEWKEIAWSKLDGPINPDWRIFARSTSDAKGPVAMFLQAMDMIHRNNLTIPFNMKVIMDFEEELGSPNLAGGVIKNREALKADHLIIFDGPLHPTYKPTLTFGARGITTVTLTIYGPDFPQHSGHYGNYVPNPAVKLSRLIASMKDDYGRVKVHGWYEDITIDEETKKILAAVPDDEDQLRVKIGFAEPDRVADNYQESIQYPSLNVRGMLSGWVGDEVRTIVPSTAIAEIDIRTVKESDPEGLLEKLRNHINEQGYTILEEKPSSREKVTNPNLVTMTHKISYQAFRTELDSETGLWLRRAFKSKNGTEPVMKRTSGGSIPISPFVNTLGVPAVTVPTVNPDNNQHSPNENIRLENFFDGILTIATILTEKI
ncbi:MAG: M20/M25/M40 family metallo-hydrolase [Saprospiraceae bacterium]|nr:M20/M25/M40 family metallo-hydrolase [Saprospiraceae bacterium]